MSHNTKKGSELIFISRINADGSGVKEVDQEEIDNDWFKKEKFRMSRLSMSNGTWIASGMNSYVVKLKKDE